MPWSFGDKGRSKNDAGKHILWNINALVNLSCLQASFPMGEWPYGQPEGAIWPEKAKGKWVVYVLEKIRDLSYCETLRCAHYSSWLFEVFK